MFQNLKSKIREWVNRSYFSLVDEYKTPSAIAESSLMLAERADKERKQLVAENTAYLSTIRSLEYQMKRVTEKYPTVWFKGDVAQGVVQIKKLRIACEFYREENRLCIIAPWNDAAGRKPTDFVPEWLEVDDTLQVECEMDSMNGTKVIIYKIPIRGWDDTITLTRKAEEDHPSYGLDGKHINKTRTFRNSNNVNGFFKREDIDGRIWCHVWYWEEEIGNRLLSLHMLLPKGNLIVDPLRSYEKDSVVTGGRTLLHWKIPVVEKEKLPVEVRIHTVGKVYDP